MEQVKMNADSETRPATQPEMEKSFHVSRFPRLPWSLLLVVYAPIGLLLTLLRVCMSLQAMLILLIFPEGALKRFLLRVFFAVLGIVVVTESFHRKGSQTKVFLSNRLSCVDHIVLHLALSCVTVSTGRKAPPLHFLFSHRTLSASSEQDLEIEAKQLPEFDGKKVHIRGVWYAVAFLSAESKSLVDFPPFVFQPEPVATNGMYMLLQFSAWPSSLASDVQPIALTARRPFGAKLTTVQQSSQWWDLFWTLFTPVTVFRVKLLAPMERREGEEVPELCGRVQVALAEELQLRRSEVTLEDVNRWIEEETHKRSASSQPVSVSPRSTSDPHTQSPSPSTSSLSSSSSQPSIADLAPDGIETMVRQVSAVMPQVPRNAIRRDLLRTQSVDATITNLLEGVVAYDPLPPPQMPSQAPATSTHAPSHSQPSSRTLTTSDLRPRKYYSPAMEAMRRQLSFEERKKQLLENARRRYVEKHSLDVNL